MTGRRALVFGGSGLVGAEVVRALAARGIATVFSYHSNTAKAAQLAQETGAQSVALDLRETERVRQFVRALDADGLAPDIFVHCAVTSRNAPLSEITAEDWDAAVLVNCRAPFVALQELAPAFARKGEGHVVLVGALDRTQSLPLPVHFAATQGMVSTMAMALAQELGPTGVRVNQVALGVLEGGLSRDLPEQQLADYRSFSALRRIGTAGEAARAIVWLATENRYMNGKVLSLNGGI